MGAFFLSIKNNGVSIENIADGYRQKGFVHPLSFDLNTYNFILCEKQLIRDTNWISSSQFTLMVCGSLFYKGMNYTDSLKELLTDLTNNNVKNDRLFGNYALILHNTKTQTLDFYVDPSFIKSLYFDKQKGIISTDFLSIAEARKGVFTYNRFAMIENIVTGNLIPPDTCLNEIERIDKINYSTMERYFPGIRFIVLTPSLYDQIKSRTEALEHANHLLSTYFADAATICNHYGAHIGLTGGFDSRLLLIHARKHIGKLIANSFWRPDSEEYENAKQLASLAGVQFFSFENQPFEAPSEQEIYYESMLVYDGQVRSQNRWDQIFALSQYTSGIANGHFVGFHGSGGEQYRNADRIIRPINAEAYIINEWIFKQASNPFKNRRLENEIYHHIKNKICRLTKIDGAKLSLENVKMIQNEVWNVANRTTRLNVLNRQSFYFAPFTEYLISHYAYKYIPYLGISAGFQVDLLRKYDKQLSSLITNYGYKPSDGEPALRVAAYYIATLIPRKLLIKLYLSMKSRKRFSDKKLTETHDFHPLIASFEEDIDFQSILRNVNLSSGIYSYNHLLTNIT